MTDDGVGRLREIADAAVNVMGNDAEILFEHHCRNGNYVFFGAAAAALVLGTTSVSAWWVGAAGFLAGFVVNEAERRRLRARIQSRTAAE